MPPKKKQDSASKKTQEKVKQKIVEDKTFGLKNKKGKKQQTFIKNVAQQVQGSQKKAEAAAGPKLSKKEQEKKKLEELNELFKPVQQAQKVAAGVDPKSVLCSFFKQGTCQKGHKCKFSHDLAIERKSEKRSLYADERDGKSEGMESWDQDTLEDVVKKKHGASNAIKTEIVCKYFLEAIEKNVYGWFWNCPNGEKCIYRHALPPGFILKKDKQKMEDEEEKVSLEEHIENERNQLTGDLTPITLETFLAWKKKKIQEKKDIYNQEMNKKKEDFKTGKLLSKISGKEMFLFKPEMAEADDDEADDDVNLYKREEEETGEDQGLVTEINLEEFSISTANFIDDTNISKAGSLLARDRETKYTLIANTSSSNTNGAEQVSGGSTGDTAGATADDIVVDGVPVDESLFEDLDDLDIDG